MFLDIAIGALLGLGTALVAGASAVAPFIVAGVVFALLPDVDFLVHRLMWRRDPIFDYKHRELLHHPLLYVPVGTALAWWASGNAALAALFALAALWHFLHDTTGVGYGVQWLWPFSTRWVGLWHGGLAWAAGHKPRTLLRTLSPAALDAFVRARYVQECPRRRNWIGASYGRMSTTLLVEVLGVAIAVVVIIAILYACRTLAACPQLVS